MWRCKVMATTQNSSVHPFILLLWDHHIKHTAQASFPCDVLTWRPAFDTRYMVMNMSHSHCTKESQPWVTHRPQPAPTWRAACLIKPWATQGSYPANFLKTPVTDSQLLPTVQNEAARPAKGWGVRRFNHRYVPCMRTCAHIMARCPGPQPTSSTTCREPKGGDRGT